MLDTVSHTSLQAKLIAAGMSLTKSGLSPACSGNVSVYDAEHKKIFISPSGMPYAKLLPEHIPFIRLSGQWDRRGFKPSSEWPFHTAIYREYPEVRAVVHCHSLKSMVLACMGQEVPADITYMTEAVMGNIRFVRALGEVPKGFPHEFLEELQRAIKFAGGSIRCSVYETPGTQALAKLAVKALKGRRACLLGNHGQIVAAANLDTACELAHEVERLCHITWAVMSAGRQYLPINKKKMKKLPPLFKNYGQPKK